MHSSSLKYTVGTHAADRRTWRLQSCGRTDGRRSQVDTSEHVLEHLQAGAAVVAGTRRVESFFQSVVEEVRLIRVDLRIPLFSGQRPDVAYIHRHVRPDASRNRQG